MTSRRCGRVAAGALVAALAGGAAFAGQQTPAPAKAPGVLRVETRLVLVDVVVTDKNGNPVPDLTQDDFTILENGRPQKIAAFSFENPARRSVERAALPPLAKNVYTNRPEYNLPPGPLTILLLDALNTPWRDQAYARAQMLHYLQTQLKPDQHTAILALTNSLLLLQSFTTDPKLLIAAVQRYTGQPSILLSQEEAIEFPSAAYEMMPAERLAGLDRFQEEMTTDATDRRVAITLAALQSIARATAGYRGRKNLVWVSSSFPFSLVPEESESFDQLRSYTEDIRRTAVQLTDAQVAVYPVDARGLVGEEIFEASSPLRNRRGGALGGPEMASTLAQRSSRLTSTHQSMYQLADDTGGKAFVNRNDIDVAMAASVADGSAYYSLAYYPENKNWDERFRRIEVKVNRAGVKVRSRRGYYARLPETKRPPASSTDAKKEAKRAEQEVWNALADPLPATGVLFQAQVPPPAPAAHAQVVADFRVDADTVEFEPTTEGRQHCDVEFVAAAISPEGRSAAMAGRNLKCEFSAETYGRVRQDGLRLQLALNITPGTYRLRLVVRDNLTGEIGSMDVPLELLPEGPPPSREVVQPN